VTHLLELLGVFFRIGLMNETAYRANFFVQAFESLVTLATALGAVAVVFTQTDSLAGWSAPELVALIGVYFLVLGSINLVIAPSLEKFMEDVVTGNLDYTLTKPADAQLLISVSQVRIWKLIDVGFGLVTVAVGTALEASEFGVYSALGFLVAMCCGATIVYSFWIVLATLAFWFIRVENILQIFWAMYMAGRWPVTLYPQWLRMILTLLVPIAFAVTVPAEALSGRLTVEMLAAAVAVAAGLAAFSRWFWLHGLSRYAGASA
jgi:viologen exporter family transport system permease protein